MSVFFFYKFIDKTERTGDQQFNKQNITRGSCRSSGIFILSNFSYSSQYGYSFSNAYSTILGVTAAEAFLNLPVH